jgi:CubicO group peptidase (beta-lactamase class C family)
MKVILLLLLSFYAIAQKKNDPSLSKKIQEFDAYVIKSQKEWEVPGLSVAIVKDGQVIFTKGYGVRELGKPDAVNAQTLFACASTTKAMTATSMGMLVDEGKVSWDDAVQKYLPEFQLFDPYVTREIKIRDLFVHDTGVGNADFLWGIMDIPSDEVLKKMRWVEPTYSLRSSFIYQNIFYLAAGKVIEKVSGKTWDQFVTERIFNPLKMTRTVPLVKLATDPNKTKPHDRIEGKITVIGFTNADQIAPAGSVWSTAEDIAKWMLCMLDSSKYADGRLVSAKTWVEMFKPQVLVPESQFYPTMQLTKPNWTTYGLGWFQQDYKGRKVNFHTGSLAGVVALHAQLPDERLGIYIFGNLDHAEVRHALVYKAFDHFALGGTRDWSTDFLKLYSGIKAESEKEKTEFEAKHILNTKLTLPIENYVGKYADPLYGEVEVSMQGDKLFFNINNFVKATFDHWHYDTFHGWYDEKWYGKGSAVFSLNEEGKISKVNFDGLEFSKKAD